MVPCGPRSGGGTNAHRGDQIRGLRGIAEQRGVDHRPPASLQPDHRAVDEARAQECRLLVVVGIILAGGPAAELCARPTEEERLTPVAARTATQKLRWRARKFVLGGLCGSVVATLAGAPLTLGHFGTASWGGVFVNLVLVPLSEIPLMLGMASVACSPADWLAGPASWINGLAGAWLHAMTWIAQACATLPGLSLELPLTQRWLGPAGGAGMAATFLAQAQSRSLLRLLGVPAGVLAGWLALAFLLRSLS